MLTESEIKNMNLSMSIQELEGLIIDLIRRNYAHELQYDQDFESLLGYRKYLLDSNIIITHQLKEQVARTNTFLEKLKNQSLKWIKAYANVMLEDNSTINHISITNNWIPVVNELEFKDNNLKSNFSTMSKALSMFSPVKLCSYIYTPNDKHFYPLGQDSLGCNSGNKVSKWKDWTPISNLENIRYSSCWYILQERSYLSISDMIRITEIEFETNCFIGENSRVSQLNLF